MNFWYKYKEYKTNIIIVLKNSFYKIKKMKIVNKIKTRSNNRMILNKSSKNKTKLICY